MSKLFFFEDGYYYPTKAGTASLIILALAALVLACIFLKRSDKRSKLFSVKALTFSAMAIALAYLTSFIQPIKLPYGGAVTLFSMLFVCLIGYWYGAKAGLLTGFAYSILQFLQQPYILTPLQVCLDYFLAFTALGLSGLFRNQKNGLQKGYLFAAFVRALCHTIGGYLFWMSYLPDNFPKVISFLYPIVYNFSYVGLEAVLTLILLTVPAVKSAMVQVKKLALS